MTQTTSRFATLASTTLLVSSLALLSACGGGSGTAAATDTSSTADNTTSTSDTSSTTTTPVQTIDVAGKVFIPTKSKARGLFLFNAGGNGTVYFQETGKSAETIPFTWNLNSADLTLAFAGDTSSFKVAQDSSTLTMSTDSTNTFTQAKPFTLAALNGKHLADTIEAGDPCTARTYSFSSSTFTIRERCSGKFYENILSAENVAGVANLVRVYGTFDGSNISAYFALQDGDLASKGTLMFVQLVNGVIDDAERSYFTAVSTPLQP